MTNTNQIIQLELNIDELNLILTALGQLPYVQVVSIMEKICKQAEIQTKETNSANK